MERLEGTFFSFDGLEIFYQLWQAVGAHSNIIITHGLAEHSECYNELAEELVKDGINVFAWDLRGHGRSEGKRGVVNQFTDYVDDLEFFINHLKENDFNDVRNFSLLGHSLGGLITLRTLVEKGHLGAESAVLSSPALGIKMEVPAIKKKSAYLLANIAPKFTMRAEIIYKNLHTDAEKLKSYKADPLRHDKISARLFLGMLDSMKIVKDKCHEIYLPILFQLSGKDKVVDTDTSEVLFKYIGSKNKKIYIYPESLHEIYNDFEKDRVIEDLKLFLKSGGQ